MAARIKKITLKKMSAVKFAALLKQLGACDEARTWAKGKTFQKVWETCPNGCWMDWLLFQTGIRGLLGWPTTEENHVSTLAYTVYWNTPEDGGRNLIKMADVFRKYVKIV